MGPRRLCLKASMEPIRLLLEEVDGLAVEDDGRSSVLCIVQITGSTSRVLELTAATAVAVRLGGMVDHAVDRLSCDARGN